MKDNYIIITGKIVAKERMKNSTYGNPKWRVVIKENELYHILETMTNGSIGYSISNYFNKEMVDFHIVHKYNKDVIVRAKED